MAGKKSDAAPTREQFHAAWDAAPGEPQDRVKALTARFGVSPITIRRWHAEFIGGLYTLACRPSCSGPETPPDVGQTRKGDISSRCIPKGAPTSEDAHSGDTWEAKRVVSERVTTLDDLLRICQADPLEWEVERWVCKSWEMGYKDADENGQSLQLFAVSATFKRSRVLCAVQAQAERLIARVSAHAPVVPARLRPARADRYLGELSLYDVHLGKLAWGPESGAHYDLGIATDLFRRGLLDLLAKAAVYSPERLLLPIGQDFFNADNSENMTTRGTPQSTDGRQARTIDGGVDLAVWAIETLLEVAPVFIPIVPGNHDRNAAYWLGKVLQAHFRNAQDVHIDNTPPLRKYHEFGANMVQFTHGDKEKRLRLTQIAAAEKREMWGRTRFRECHSGHRHITQVDEFPGMRVRTVPSMCAAEDWHCESGYTGTIRSAEAFIWGHDDGLVGQYAFTVPQELCA